MFALCCVFTRQESVFCETFRLFNKMFHVLEHISIDVVVTLRVIFMNLFCSGLIELKFS